MTALQNVVVVKVTVGFTASGTRLKCSCRLVNKAKSEMICTTVILTPLHFMRYIITDRIESSRYLHDTQTPTKILVTANRVPTWRAQAQPERRDSGRAKPESSHWVHHCPQLRPRVGLPKLNAASAHRFPAGYARAKSQLWHYGRAKPESCHRLMYWSKLWSQLGFP